MANEIPRTHTDMSPSNAHRWMNCPGSVSLCASLPKPPQGPYAAEGQAAHALLEMCLLNPKISPFDLVGTEIEGYEINDEMADAISFTLDIIRADLQKGGELLVEQRLEIIPGLMTGYIDVAIIKEFEKIAVYDFKYGRGTIVTALDNPQLLLYAMALYREHDASIIESVIIQPRTENQISRVEYFADYLDIFKEEINRKIELTKEKDPFFATGDWCKFCYGKVNCPKLKNDIKENLPAIPGKELIFPDAKTLTPVVIQRVLDYRERIEGWLDAVCSYAQEFVEAGGVIEGYELAKKRANRQWRDEGEALEAFVDLGDKAFKVKILTPAQMEKLAGKDRVAQLTVVPDKGMTLKKAEKKK